MGLFNSGVSGGAAVSNQANGVSLSQVGDYAILFVSNAAPPGGPDVSALISLSGGASANVSIQKQFVPTGSWTTLSGVTVGGVGVPDPYLMPGVNRDLQANLITGLYAIRVLLDTVGATPLLVQGISSPSASGAPSPATLAAFANLAALNTAQVLAQSYNDGINYFDAAAALVLP